MGHLKYWLKGDKQASECGIRVAELLDRWQGLHHMENDQMAKVDWSNPNWQELKLNSAYSCGSMATYDFSALTTLVFLAHDLCIRVDVHPCNPRFLRLMFHPRQRDGSMSHRHPTLTEAVSKWRDLNAASPCYTDDSTPAPAATPIRIITMDHQDQDIPDDYHSDGEQKPLAPPELTGQPNRDASPEPRNWSAGYETD